MIGEDIERRGPTGMRASAAVVGAVLSGLLSASLLGTASAHVGECSASTDEAFDYQVSERNREPLPCLVSVVRYVADVLVQHCLYMLLLTALSCVFHQYHFHESQAGAFFSAYYSSPIIQDSIRTCSSSNDIDVMSFGYVASRESTSCCCCCRLCFRLCF